MIKDFSFPTENFLLLGKVAKAHSMQGEVKIFPYSGQPENISLYSELVLVDSKGKLSPPLTVLSSRPQGKVAITRLHSISDRDKAESIEGMGVLLARKYLPKLDDNEFYWHQYIGKNVKIVSGEMIGKIETVFPGGAQDIMVVKNGSREILIPILASIVIKESSSEIVIDPPPGLVELYTDSYGGRDN